MVIPLEEKIVPINLKAEYKVEKNFQEKKRI
jgi:hypothetical protein